MILADNFRAAGQALWAYKLRTGLTMLGIVVGVASVITIVAIGLGARAQIDRQIATLGANILMVMPGAGRDRATRLGAGSLNTISELDAQIISAEIDGVTAAAPALQTSAQVIAGNQNWKTTIGGTTPDYFIVREWALAAGRTVSQSDIDAGARIAVIGSTIAAKIFGADKNVLGRQFRIDRVPFEVVGVLAEKGMSGTGRDQDDVVFVPITTARQRLIGTVNPTRRDAVNYVLVKAVGARAMAEVERGITERLRAQHRLVEDADDDFRIVNPRTAMEARTESTRTAVWMLAIVASVSLLVGGINIMNTMLVVVAERTREIGLRLAIGGRPRDVRNQFIVEAATLAAIGGAIGVAVGVALAHLVAALAGWPIHLPLPAILIAVAFAASVGIVFGYIPAHHAAGKSPSQCLIAG